MVTIDYLVMNIRPEGDEWVAERMDGEIIKVEPDNYDFWLYAKHNALYSRKLFEDEINFFYTG